MFGSKYFRYVHGEYQTIGILSTSALALSTADAAVGVVKRGKAVKHHATDRTLMNYADQHGGFLGFLIDNIDQYGQTGIQAYFDRDIGKIDLNKKKGDIVTIRQPFPGAKIEVEGVGDATIENLLATTSTGALADNTPQYTELTLVNGCWRIATFEEVVYGKLIRMMTAISGDSGAKRAEIEIVSGYKIAPQDVDA